MKNRSLWTVAFLAFLAAWGALGGAGGCSTGSPSQAASASVYEYTVPPWINAAGVIWPPAYDPEDTGIRLEGGDSYIFGGGVDGPIPASAVYECAKSDDPCPDGYSEHCPGGSSGVCGLCPVPCLEFHQTEAVQHASSGGRPLRYTDFCARRQGDGVSAEPTGAGAINIERSYFSDLHDDAAEHDFCKPMMIVDSLFDRAFMGFALDPRSGVDPTACRSATIHLDGVLLRNFRWAYAYKNKPGHGGVFKLDDDYLPFFVVKNSTFMIGGATADKGPGNGQHFLPPPHRVTECSNNLILFAGDAAQKAAWLADEDGADGLTNAEKLAALSACYAVLYRDPSTQTFFDFFFLEWTPRVDAWLAAHPRAAAGCDAG